MGAPRDIWNATSRLIKPPIHRLCSWAFGGYAMTDNTEDEYVATVAIPEPEFETILAAAPGFRREPVSSLKIRIDGNVSDGSWAWRASALADRQLHLMLHAVEEGVEVYAHWEYSWITHPLKHYRAEGCHPERGVEMARTWLETYESEAFPDGIPFEVQSFYWRAPWYLTVINGVSEDAARWLSSITRREKRRIGISDL